VDTEDVRTRIVVGLLGLVERHVLDLDLIVHASHR